MAFHYQQTAKALLDLVGGESNIASVTHCITRLRFVLRDKGKVNRSQIEQTAGVLKVIEQGGQFQIVIGSEVVHVYKEVTKLGDFSEIGESSVSPDEEEWIFARVCGFVAGCMTPLLPAMLGCGMINVILTILVTLKLIDIQSNTYLIFTIMGDTFFYFLPIMLAYTTARKVGMNPFVAMAIGGVMLHPDMTVLLAEEGVRFIGLPVTSVVYSASVLPILLMVPIMGGIERFAERISPDMLKVFLKPLIVLLISLPIALIVIGPLGFIVGNYLAMGINFLYQKVGWLTIMVLSIFMPFIVMTGMHYALGPLVFMSLATFGYDALLLVTTFCSNISQGAAAFAVAFRTKDKEQKSIAAACGVSAVIAGITEPAMYGITLKYKKPMTGAMIGAGVAGLYAGITGLVVYVMGGSASVLSLFSMVGGDGLKNVIHGMITLIISFSVSFIATFILYKDESKPQPNDEADHLEVERSNKHVSV